MVGINLFWEYVKECQLLSNVFIEYIFYSICIVCICYLLEKALNCNILSRTMPGVPELGKS